MKTNLSFLFRLMTWITPLSAWAGASAGPLIWFPGPTLDGPRSGAATAVFSGGNNLLIGGDSSVVQELAATDIYWTYLSPFLYSALAPGAVAGGGMVIVYGGNDGTSSTSAVIGYSPTDGSAPLASMNVPRSYLGYAPDGGGNAYAFGGLDANGQALSSAEVYNQDSTAWAAIASLPTALYDFPAVFNGTNYIYIFGGRTNSAAGTETAEVLRYSVSADTWTVMTPMPVATAGSAAALGADGKIYVVGGVSGGVTANVVQAYDPAANSWVTATPLPEGLSASAMGLDSVGRLI
ncbi:MAG: kelch repeat-containing protein, partial [Verrucomicrobiota bacterium]